MLRVKKNALYIIYVSDPLITHRTSLALYADDTAIMSRSRSGRLLTRYLQEEITALDKWCNKWKIDLNAEKTQAIVFKRRSRWTRNSTRHLDKKMGKPHRIRQTESQSDQCKTVPHDKQDIEARTSEQSDADQVGS